jgi:hypothetical protein
MNMNVMSKDFVLVGVSLASDPRQVVGESFIQALGAQDFDALETMFAPKVRFRSLVPGEEYNASTAAQAVALLRDWFGSLDTIEVEQSASELVSDRLHISYRLRVHDGDGWQLIEQHAFCALMGERIADMWLVCSGFRPVPNLIAGSGGDANPLPMPHLGGDVFYDAGPKGCAEGSLDEIVRRIRQMAPGQTLEIHATDPSVAADLPSWCRLSGHEFLRQDGNYFLIRHK